jgi:hypothetical protein
MLRSCPMVKIIWSTQPVVVERAGRSGRDHQGLVFCADRVRRVATAVDDAKDSSSKITPSGYVEQRLGSVGDLTPRRGNPHRPRSG